MYVRSCVRVFACVFELIVCIHSAILAVDSKARSCNKQMCCRAGRRYARIVWTLDGFVLPTVLRSLHSAAVDRAV